MKNKYYLSLVIKEDESEYDEKEDSFKNEEFDDLNIEDFYLKAST